MLCHISPTILQLQGRLLCTETLEEIRKAQNNEEAWNGNIGYMSFITDERDTDYNRRYIGQTNDAQRTIIRQHCQNLLSKSTCSLPRFIIWVGNGNRTANFIRLWSYQGAATQNSVETWRQNQMNILQALFCKAFRTNDGVFSRPEGDQSLRLKRYGLNILTPLIQCGIKLDASHEEYVDEMTTTADTQILFWTQEIRPKLITLAKTEQSKQIQASRDVLKCDFDDALKAALYDEGLLQQVLLSLNKASPRFEGRGLEYGKPSYFGNLKAKIAFVLDYAAVSPESYSFEEDDHSMESASNIGLPWPLQGCQLNETNTLAWTWNFRDFAPLGKKNLSCKDETVKAYHQKLVGNSNARIVFLCGTRAAEALRFAYTTQQYSLELRGFRYPLYVANGILSTQVPRRLFILCPALPERIWSTNGCDGAKLSEALRFAISLLDLKGLRPYFLETSSVAGSILSWARGQRLGGPSMTLGKMDPNIRLWLARKGVPKDRLEKISGISGSLSQGLLMMFYPPSKKPSEEDTQPQKRRQDRQGKLHVPRKRVKRIVNAPSTHVAEDDAPEATKGVVGRITKRQQTSAKGKLSNRPLFEADVQDTSSGINILLGKDSPSPAKLEEIRSVIFYQRSSPRIQELEDGNAQDVSVRDLIPICSEAIKLGFLPTRPKPQDPREKEEVVLKN